MRRFYVVIIFFLLLNCWKHQSHKITAPTIPNYILSGKTIDIDTGEIIPYCKIYLQPIMLVYEDVDFTGITDTSDSIGCFEFNNITPGQYTLIAKRGKYVVSEENIVMEHKDKDLIIKLPKPLIAFQEYAGTYSDLKSPRLYGFEWTGQLTLMGIYHWDMTRWRVITGNFDSGFKIIGEKGLNQENPKLNGFTFLINYWTCSDNWLCTISFFRGNVESQVRMPYPMLDLTNDGNNLWATTSAGKIIQFSAHAAIVKNEYSFPGSNPGGIAWDGQHIWTNDIVQNLVFQLDDNMNIEKTYRPIFDNISSANVIQKIGYLSFDKSGDLWAGNVNAIYRLSVK